MPAPVDPPRGTTALLVVEAAHGAWALPSAAVTGIEPFDPASIEPLLDVPALLGDAFAAPGAVARVLSVQASEQRLRVLARGALVLKTVEERELLPLPPYLTPSSTLVSHVGVVDGKPALLVVSPERLRFAPRPPALEPSPKPAPLTEERPC